MQGVHGAGVLQNQCEGNITSCTFSDNYATEQGGSCSASHLPLNSWLLVTASATVTKHIQEQISHCCG